MRRIIASIALGASLGTAAFLGGSALGVAGAQETPTTEAPAADAPSSDLPATPPADAPPDAPMDGCEGRGGRGAPGLDAAAEAIGISADDLRAALHDGQTIAEVAEANGVDVSTVADAMVADAQAHLADEVAEGHLTQDEADARLADLESHIDAMIDGELPPPGPRGPHGPRPDDGTAPSDSTVPSSSDATVTPSGLAA